MLAACIHADGICLTIVLSQCCLLQTYENSVEIGIKLWIVLFFAPASRWILSFVLATHITFAICILFTWQNFYSMPIYVLILPWQIQYFQWFSICIINSTHSFWVILEQVVEIISAAIKEIKIAAKVHVNECSTCGIE